MSLLKRAIDARARGDSATPARDVDVSYDSCRRLALGRILEDGTCVIVSTGDADADRDRLRQLQRIRDEEDGSVDGSIFLRAAEAHAAHLEALKRRQPVTEKKKSRKKDRGIEGIREAYR